MARIIIELEDSGAKVSTQPSAAGSAQQAAYQAAAASTVPLELAARAAAVGALDAGPAPSLGVAQSFTAPVPHISPGAPSQSGLVSVSAGTAPEGLSSSPKP
jgi:hypothetical protein